VHAAVSGSQTTAAHARRLLLIKLHKKTLQYRKQCSKFGDDRSINNVAIASTDAGRTLETGHVNMILYSVQSTALHCIGQTIKSYIQYTHKKETANC